MVNHLLRLAGWYSDLVLKTWFPQHQEPSMADLAADALAAKEAEEDVAEPNRVPIGINDMAQMYMSVVPNSQLSQLCLITTLLEDIRNILNSSVATEAAERPDTAVPPAASGHLNISFLDLHAACSGISQWVHGDPCPPHNHAAWGAIADRLYQLGNEIEFTQ